MIESIPFIKKDNIEKIELNNGSKLNTEKNSGRPLRWSEVQGGILHFLKVHTDNHMNYNVPLFRLVVELS